MITILIKTICVTMRYAPNEYKDEMDDFDITLQHSQNIAVQ